MIVGDIFGYKTRGDLGIEIELETDSNRELPYSVDSGLPKTWKAEGDGSLRGNSIEYIFRKPLDLKETYIALDDLTKSLKDKKITIRDSIRAGVHVHVNVQDLTPTQVLNFASVYYVLEEVLVDWCGQNRQGNLFCLRNVDAEGSIQFIAKCFKEGRLGNLADNSIRYASLNFCALPKFGSLEFRALKTEPSFDKIKMWSSLLLRLKNKSLEINTITEIMEQFSIVGPKAWAEDILGDFYQEVKDYPEFEQKTWRGLRFAQDLLFFSS
tara:strand:- start:675 stop:1478 length:804 start_codon:yes stop_codon:yes gene_type:complete